MRIGDSVISFENLVKEAFLSVKKEHVVNFFYGCIDKNFKEIEVLDK